MLVLPWELRHMLVEQQQQHRKGPKSRLKKVAGDNFIFPVMF